VYRFALVLAFLVACAADVGEGRTAATIEEVPVASPVPAAATGTVLAVDPARSTLGAIGAKITAQHSVSFPQFKGEIALNGEEISSVSFEADVAMLVADAERLTDHLKREDFLFVEQFPKATFASTEIRAGSEVAGQTHTVTGDLTIRGQTQRVSFPAKIAVGPADVTASSEFVVNRHDFGVAYPGKPDDLVQDNVAIRIAFVAPRS
jgi:polyisoprenoid-binding protein YceI